MSRPRENNCPVNALENLGLADAGLRKERCNRIRVDKTH
jgi:hypothetical protein